MTRSPATIDKGIRQVTDLPVGVTLYLIGRELEELPTLR
jgi:hypothetical protein